MSAVRRPDPEELVQVTVWRHRITDAMRGHERHLVAQGVDVVYRFRVRDGVEEVSLWREGGVPPSPQARCNAKRRRLNKNTGEGS